MSHLTETTPLHGAVDFARLFFVLRSPKLSVQKQKTSDKDETSLPDDLLFFKKRGGEVAFRRIGQNRDHRFAFAQFFSKADGRRHVCSAADDAHTILFGFHKFPNIDVNELVK